jgi:maltose O-acetyltransferase
VVPSPFQVWDSGTALLRARWYFRDAAELGERVRLWGRPRVVNRGILRIGARCRFVSNVATLELQVGPEGTLEIGEGVFMNSGCSIGAMMLIRIGAGCSLGPQVIIMDNDFHQLEPERRNEVPPSAPVILEKNVWLGARVIVLRGVTIGEGSVVAAGSVVTKDVPPRSVVGGIPARFLRTL